MGRKATRDPDRGNRHVFVGSIVDAYKSIGASMGLYTNLFNALYETGCIEKIVQGRAGRPSVVVLHHPPDRESFERIYRSTLTAPREPDILAQRVSNLERRLDGVDLKAILKNHEDRISSMERREDNGKKS